VKKPNPQHRGLIAGKNIKISPGKIIHRWRFWPQQLARNETRPMGPWRNARRAESILSKLEQLRNCADALAKRTRKRRDEIVVFYPMRYKIAVMQRLRERMLDGSIASHRGLVCSATKRLRGYCVAFLIADVEKHRTPADAYRIVVERGAAHSSLRPRALYGSNVKGTGGKEIHE